MTIEQLAGEHGCTALTMSRALKRGGAVVKHGGSTASPLDVAEVARLYRDGMGIRELVTHFHSSHPSISFALHQAGVRERPTWKHRYRPDRVKAAAGYMLIRVAPDHPHVAMAQSRGYVLEHRLVMAVHLGRDLLKSESVHHVNGRRDDNRIENLELWRGASAQPSGVRAAQAPHCPTCTCSAVGH